MRPATLRRATSSRSASSTSETWTHSRSSTLSRLLTNHGSPRGLLNSAACGWRRATLPRPARASKKRCRSTRRSVRDDLHRQNRPQGGKAGSGDRLVRQGDRRRTNNPEPYQQYGDFYFRQNDFEKATGWYEKALNARPDAMATHLQPRVRPNGQGRRERSVRVPATGGCRRLHRSEVAEGGPLFPSLAHRPEVRCNRRAVAAQPLPAASSRKLTLPQPYAMPRS